MNIADKQVREELTVFRAFAVVCKSLTLMPETAIKLPDRKHEPDILCKLSSGELLTFELVQCEDVTKDDSHPDGFSQIFPKRLNEKMDLENALAKVWRHALDDRRIDQPDRFKFHLATVYLEAVSKPIASN